MQDQNESLLDILSLLWKKKKSILTTTVIVGVLSAGVSLLLPNWYEASTQFYAASPDLALPAPIGNLRASTGVYGNNQDIDRLISISKSNTLNNFLIDSFQLYEHYEIKPGDAKAKHKLLLKLDKLYNVTKTKYDAIRLSVEDKDPEYASKMANAARIKIEEEAQHLIKDSQLGLIESHRSNIDIKQKKYDAIADSLLKTRIDYNIFNTQSQGEAFGTSMVEIEGNIQNFAARINLLKGKTDVTPDSIYIMEAKLSGFRKEYETLKKNINDYNHGYPLILRYERELRDFGNQLNLDKERLKQLEAVYNGNINAIHVVEIAETPVYKSRPRRSILVIGIAGFSFVLMCLWVILKEQLKGYNWDK